MAEIQEIPLDQTENSENNPDNIEITQEICIDNHGEPAPKKKGRPPGAKNKPKPPAPKPKPKAKKKKQSQAPEYEEESDEYEEEPPRHQRRTASMSQPREVDRHALAAEVLGILQQQRYNQTTARRSHYASWFTNM